MLALRSMLWHAYYALNYAGIIGASLQEVVKITVPTKIKIAKCTFSTAVVKSYAEEACFLIFASSRALSFSLKIML